MKINLNQCNYSHANAIGSTLKTPLFLLTRNIAIAAMHKPWETRAQVISRTALHALIALALIVPAFLAWTVGRIITYFSATQINHKMLHLAPPPISIPEESETDNSIDITVLKDRFAQLFPQETSKLASLNRLCEWINFQSEQIYEYDPAKRELFCKEVSLFLKGIIKKMNDGSVPNDKIKDILMELAKASMVCYPTWLNMAAKLYNEIHGRDTAVENVLRMVQEYKEALILEFVQQEADVQWHSLNFVRNIVGDDLGLNTSLNKFDPYSSDKDPVFGKSLTKFLFLQRYENANRMVTAIKEVINSQAFDMRLYDLLIERVEKNGFEKIIDHKNKMNSVETAADFVVTQFYEETSDGNRRINEKGVNFILKSIEVLK